MGARLSSPRTLSSCGSAHNLVLKRWQPAELAVSAIPPGRVLVPRATLQTAHAEPSVIDGQPTVVARAGRLPWGFYQLRATTADGRVVVSRPVFVDPPSRSEDLVGYWPFDHGTDYRVLDASPWMRDGRLGARTHYAQHQPRRVRPRTTLPSRCCHAEHV